MSFLETVGYAGWCVLAAYAVHFVWRNRRPVVPIEYLQNDITRARIRRASQDGGE